MTATIRCVVFSLDRPMQLEALLTSIRRHVGGMYQPVIVLYRTTNARFAAGYELVRAAHAEVDWVEERNFRTDLLGLVETDGLLVFHTDDDLFFAQVDPFALHDGEVCFSFRLGLNISYSYSLDLAEHLECPTVSSSRVSWAWRDQPAGSFSYPLALNGHVFRGDEIGPLIAAVEFSDPNELEAELHSRRDHAPPRMASFPTSRVVSVPANVVTRSFRNRHGGVHTPEDMNDRFLAGERIAAESMAFGAVSSCHEEIPFAFVAVPST